LDRGFPPPVHRVPGGRCMFVPRSRPCIGVGKPKNRIGHGSFSLTRKGVWMSERGLRGYNTNLRRAQILVVDYRENKGKTQHNGGSCAYRTLYLVHAYVSKRDRKKEKRGSTIVHGTCRLNISSYLHSRRGLADDVKLRQGHINNSEAKVMPPLRGEWVGYRHLQIRVKKLQEKISHRALNTPKGGVRGLEHSPNFRWPA